MFYYPLRVIAILQERIYHSKPETKADFIIRFDLKAGKYELALRREDMARPVIIPEDAYEVLALRNDNHCFKSPNFSQVWDAWRW